jgi:two-component system osmolarity sensor histidine kinase EnvZ
MIVPMVVLQTVVAFVFMERHWNTVTRRLSAAVVQDIASLIDVYKFYPQDKDRAQLRRVAQRMQLVVDFLPVGDLPPPGPKPFSRCSTRRCRCSSAGRSQTVLDRYRRPL